MRCQRTLRELRQLAQSEWGKTYTGVVLANLIGADASLQELVVAHSDNKISIHENTGKLGAPSFLGTVVQATIQKNCQGRLDVADWDGDGLLDLVTGSFGGNLVWYRNEGTQQAPQFGDGEPFHDLSRAYNAQLGKAVEPVNEHDTKKHVDGQGDEIALKG